MYKRIANFDHFGSPSVNLERQPGGQIHPIPNLSSFRRFRSFIRNNKLNSLNESRINEMVRFPLKDRSIRFETNDADSIFAWISSTSYSRTFLSFPSVPRGIEARVNIRPRGETAFVGRSADGGSAKRTTTWREKSAKLRQRVARYRE